MSVGYVGLKSVQAIYDFDNDGGAISTIGLDVFLPDNATLVRCSGKVVTTFASGAAATVALGWTGDTDALMVVTGFGAFAAGQVILGRDFGAVPVDIDNAAGREVAITIAAAALTAGLCLFNIWYEENDQ